MSESTIPQKLNIRIKVDEKAREITLIIPMQQPTPSKKTGRTLIIASTHGSCRTDAKFQGRPVSFGANFYVPNSDKF